MMKPLLKSISLLEVDKNNDTMWVWSFPSISALAKSSIQAKLSFEPEEFIVVRLEDGFYYTLTKSGSESTKNVLSVVCVLLTNDFYPEKYHSFLQMLIDAYLTSGSPPDMLQLYLMAQRRQNVVYNEVTVDLQRYASPYENVPIKELIRTFQLESILIYTALLLNLRVVVYHHSSTDLRHMLAAMAALMSHRENPFGILYPLLGNSETDLGLIKDKSSYLIGVTDPSVRTRLDIIDLWIAFPSAEIVIAPHAKESLSRCKAHKDVALFMCRCSENSRLSNKDVVKEVANKTRNLLASIAKIVHENPALSAQKAIESAGLPPTMEAFFKAAARVEKIHN